MKRYLILGFCLILFISTIFAITKEELKEEIKDININDFKILQQDGEKETVTIAKNPNYYKEVVTKKEKLFILTYVLMTNGELFII